MRRPPVCTFLARRSNCISVAGGVEAIDSCGQSRDDMTRVDLNPGARGDDNRRRHGTQSSEGARTRRTYP
jgi:hypothetical protein